MFDSADSVLVFALKLEEHLIKSYAFAYEHIACKTIHKIFESIVDVEKEHYNRLNNIRKSGYFNLNPTALELINSQNYSKQLVDVDDTQCYEILEKLMQLEKLAFCFYNSLTPLIEDHITRLLFEGLARDESSHKLQIELEIDKLVKSHTAQN